MTISSSDTSAVPLFPQEETAPDRSYFYLRELCIALSTGVCVCVCVSLETFDRHR